MSLEERDFTALPLKMNEIGKYLSFTWNLDLCELLKKKT